MSSALFDPIRLGNISLPNRIIMAPLTRCRATEDRVPTDIMMEYYTQRSSAGLIISEATVISTIAAGYIRTPGIYNIKQIEAWRNITEALHENNGRIYCQLWHVGRSSHPDFHDGELPVAPSAIQAAGKILTPNGVKDKVTPRTISIQEIDATIEDYVNAAINAIEAGFDGIEIHGANGYLIDQFICDGSNIREDEYGGSIENRCRFAIEVVEGISNAIGHSRTAIRLSPSGTFNGMIDSTPKETFGYLVNELNKFDLAYLHLTEPYSPVGKKFNPPEYYLQDREVTPYFRKIYNGKIITNCGYDKASGEEIINKGDADMVAYGKLFLSNPDLPNRFKNNYPLNEWDANTFYTHDRIGYTDYPSYKQV